jgi:hypothetical protein
MFREGRRVGCEGPRRRARIGMDEDKPCKRDTQLLGSASAKRFSRTRTVRLGARPLSAPRAPSAIFLALFARKPLIILDYGKKKEIFGSRWKAF